MMIGLLALSVAPCSAEVMVAQSGLHVAYFDTIDEAPTYRLRYTAPALADATLDYATVADDMTMLCQDDALPRLAEAGANPSQVVITLMAAPVEFGVITPEIRQFFESYSIQDGLCIWEAF
jgi:hypothetical protein